ncbi:hypothetical protein ACSDQ5_001982 [Cronobacter sakazakii]
MTTDDLVTRYFNRIDQAGNEACKGMNLHNACNEVDKAIAGANESFSFHGGTHPSEGFEDLLKKLSWASRTGETTYRHVINYALKHIKLKLEDWKA